MLLFLLLIDFCVWQNLHSKSGAFFCSAFQIAVLSLNFCYINVRSAQYIVHIAYATNAVNLPYINVDKVGRIAAYAPEPSPKIAKRIMI